MRYVPNIVAALLLGGATFAAGCKKSDTPASPDPDAAQREGEQIKKAVELERKNLPYQGK